MKVSLPTISAIQDTSDICEIDDYYISQTGDPVYRYTFRINAITNDLLNNDISSLTVKLVPAKSQSPTNDFRKIASGDLSPVANASAVGYQSLVEESSSPEASETFGTSFSGGHQEADSTRLEFNKNSQISKSILSSHIQIKNDISSNREKESLEQIGSDVISVDASIGTAAKQSLLSSKMKSSIVSGRGDSISLGSKIYEIFSDGGYEMKLKGVGSILSKKSSKDSPMNDSILVQKFSPSITTNIGSNAVEYELDSRGDVSLRSGVKNKSVSTAQDSLSGEIERSGNGRSTISSVYSNTTVASWSLINHYGLSPAEIVSKNMGDFINSASDNFSGISTRSSDILNKIASEPSSNLKSYDVSQLVGTLRGGVENIPLTPPTKISDLSSSDIVPVVSQTSTKNTEFSTTIEVPHSKVSSGEFYVLLDLTATDGRVLQATTIKIDHTSKVSDLLYPRIAPTVTVSEMEFSGATITVNQMDPGANKVLIMTRPVDSMSIESNIQFKNIGTFKADYLGDPIFVSINQNPGKTTLIRCISIGKDGTYGRFSDSIFKPSKTVSRSDINSNIGSASITATNISAGIEIVAKPTSGTPVSVNILRKNLTTGERRFSIISSRESQSKYSKGKKYKLIDSEAHSDHTYEYKCEFTYTTGERKILESSAISTRTAVIDNVKISCGQRSVKRLGTKGAYSISLDANMNIPSSDADRVKTTFDELGLSELFGEDIDSIKDNFDKIAIFNVKRLDVNSGIEHDLGLKSTGKFTDAGDSSRGIPAPSSGGEYLYKFEAFVRTPAQVIKETESTQTARNTSNINSLPSIELGRSKSSSATDTNPNYSEKFTSPTVLRSSTMSYGSALSSRHSENTFELGRTGVIKTVTVSTPIVSPSVRSLNKIRVNKKNEAILTWSVSSEGHKIDHFIILAKRSGVTIPVGTHHSASRNLGFTYVDRSQMRIIGKVDYSIVPVYLDYSQGEPVRIGSVTIGGNAT